MHALIEIDKGWLAQEEQLMRRITAIINGPQDPGLDAFQPPFSKDGSRWQVDFGNNHWAEIRDGKLELASRYGGPKFDALVNFVTVWLGPMT